MNRATASVGHQVWKFVLPSFTLKRCAMCHPTALADLPGEVVVPVDQRRALEDAAGDGEVVLRAEGRGGEESPDQEQRRRRAEGRARSHDRTIGPGPRRCPEADAARGGGRRGPGARVLGPADEG